MIDRLPALELAKRVRDWLRNSVGPVSELELTSDHGEPISLTIRRGLPVTVIVGDSGTGKSSLAHDLVEKHLAFKADAQALFVTSPRTASAIARPQRHHEMILHNMERPNEIELPLRMSPGSVLVFDEARCMTPQPDESFWRSWAKHCARHRLSMIIVAQRLSDLSHRDVPVGLKLGRVMFSDFKHSAEGGFHPDFRMVGYGQPEVTIANGHVRSTSATLG